MSRLDRLFILLDTGSNESVRLAAARQLGEVQRAKPNELSHLLTRIKEYSKKSSWDTRVAAGHAIKYILQGVDRWPPTDVADCARDSRLLSDSEVATIINNFDLDLILEKCPKLLSLDTIDVEEQGAGTTNPKRRSKYNKEQLLRQRKLINKELGMMDNFGVNATDIVTNDDLLSGQQDKNPVKNSESPNDLCSVIKNYISSYQTYLATQTEAIIDKVHTCWPLQSFTDEYRNDLFDSSWEIRHGAAIALREFVKLHGKSAGRYLGPDDIINDNLNKLWLIDMSLSAIIVLTLDRFGDFLFDQVVAPVRENAAQLLGCCLSHLDDASSYRIIMIVLKMLHNPSWETRHGGVLGIKYSLSIFENTFAEKILSESFDHIFKCLADTSDDVSAEAAAALVPVKDLMTKCIPDKTPQLIRFLWDHLADLDELTTSTSNIILLLASLITTSSTQLEPSELIRSIPKLWPLLSHSSTSVRSSVMRALITLLKPQKSDCIVWMPEELYTSALRLIFQRSILENVADLHTFIRDVWALLIKVNGASANTSRYNLLKYTSPYINYWLCLVMQQVNVPIDRGNALWLNLGADGQPTTTKPDVDVFIASSTFNVDTVDQQKQQITRCRLLSADLVGMLYANLIKGHDEEPADEHQHIKDALEYLSEMFVHYIKTRSANQRMFSSWVLDSWAQAQARLIGNADKLSQVLPNKLKDQIHQAILEKSLYFDELASLLTGLQQEARSLVAAIKEAKMDLPAEVPKDCADRKVIFNLKQIQSLAEHNIENEYIRIHSKIKQENTAPRTLESLDMSQYQTCLALIQKQTHLSKSFEHAKESQRKLSRSVLSSLAYVHVAWRLLPNKETDTSKLDTLIALLTDSVFKEVEPAVQEKSIDHLINLWQLISMKPAFKGVIDRSTHEIASALLPQTRAKIDNESSSEKSDTNGQDNQKTPVIIYMDNLMKQERVPRRSVTSAPGAIKRQAASIQTVIKSETIMTQDELSTVHEIRMRGASSVMIQAALKYGEHLPNTIGLLWTKMTKFDADIESEKDTLLALVLLDVMAEGIHESLIEVICNQYANIIDILAQKGSDDLYRNSAARCLGTLNGLMFDKTIQLIKERVLTMLDSASVYDRCGGIEAIAYIAEKAQLKLVPHINIFIIKVLRRLNDPIEMIRITAAHCFAKLLSLMPLEASKGIVKQEPCGDDDDESRFIEQLLEPKKLDNYVLPFKMNATLRAYQQEGLNWLAFLNRFNLHGVLCDEMGLGKTFMTICMVAASHHKQSKCRKPSLIMCPSTLVEHWLYEIRKFVPDESRDILRPIAYSGNITDRNAIKNEFAQIYKRDESSEDCRGGKAKLGANLVIASYDIVRNDIEFFAEIHWNYCVLDEGHIIKNGKTKLSRAIRQISSENRLILSGTPIQNNVTELWSLFDFLMPGYLGSERQFNMRYAKPILQSREPKCSSRELEAGALAMESLHRQVLPFILRRLKDDVLDDLPPKILQDYYCELSPLQQKLYEDFTRSRMCKEVTKKSLAHLEELNDEQVSYDAKSRGHVFQALQYLKSVCNHPKLVLSDKHSQYKTVMKMLQDEKTTLDDIAHSSKLTALKQLLVECCGIGASANSDDGAPVASSATGSHKGCANTLAASTSAQAVECAVKQHRALIFCQIRSMVNIIENDLLKKHLPNITYLKLDGSIPANQRQSIVSRFNDDPSIDILLLTTQIGGLGLNLTGADTVIFVEHDWNPTKDQQAMDRAHRIGQKKVVNVYRLITKGTLEEKIMGLQKFKTMISNTIINQDNAGLSSMNVSQLFDLFETSDSAGSGSGSGSGDASSTVDARGNKSFVDLLPELWDQQNYEVEYDLSNFVSSLKN